MSDIDNPYEAPSAAMPVPVEFGQGPLTQYQRQNLKAYRAWHRNPPSFGRLILNFRNLYFALILCSLLFLLLSIYVPDLGVLATVLLGFSAGMLVHSLILTHATVDIWPMLDWLIDWDRARKLEEGETDATP